MNALEYLNLRALLVQNNYIKHLNIIYINYNKFTYYTDTMPFFPSKLYTIISI